MCFSLCSSCLVLRNFVRFHPAGASIAPSRIHLLDDGRDFQREAVHARAEIPDIVQKWL